VAASALLTGASAIFKGMARRGATTLTVSSDLRRWLIDTNGFDPERVLVKYNGVPRPPADIPMAPAASSATYVFAGYLHTYKGVDLLLDAWARADLPDARLQILGDGPLVDLVQAAAADDSRIDYVGLVPRAAMPTYLGAARAVVVPSTWAEALPRIAAEGLAQARPVITTGLGGLSELVGDEAGWVTGTDVEHLAAALRESADDEAVEARAQAAQVRYETMFSPEVTTKALLDIYEHAVANARERPFPFSASER
jgi:glycosyltransferase involved in cell wall biosynthesis